MDLTGPLQLGGLPWAPHTGQVSQKDFIGCISDVYIDNELLDLNSSIVNILTDVGCPYKETHCQSSPCTFAGKCLHLRAVFCYRDRNARQLQVNAGIRCKMFYFNFLHLLFKQAY